jgi:hypothetical protein
LEKRDTDTTDVVLEVLEVLEISFSEDWEQDLSNKAQSTGSGRCFDRNGRTLNLIDQGDGYLRINTSIHDLPSPGQFPLKVYQEGSSTSSKASTAFPQSSGKSPAHDSAPGAKSEDLPEGNQEQLATTRTIAFPKRDSSITSSWHAGESTRKLKAKSIKTKQTSSGALVASSHT